MADKMYIPNDDTQNYPCCRLVVETFGKSSKELISQRCYKTLGTSQINSRMSPPFLDLFITLTWGGASNPCSRIKCKNI